MTERAWYQDGGCVFWLLAIAGLIALSIIKTKEENRPTVYPSMTGRIEQPFFGSPSLVITAWHQHTGVLRNGRLTIEVKGTDVAKRGSVDSQEFSFETWEPNQDHAVTMRFPLKQVDPQCELSVACSLIASDIKPSTQDDMWLGNHWKSNQTTPP